MPNHPLRSSALVLAATIAVVSLSCALLPVGSRPGEGGDPGLSPLATPTPTVGLLSPDTQPDPTTPDSPGQMEIELRFVDPASQQTCVAHFPFGETAEGGQRRISGGGLLDCQCEVQQCGDGACVMYHSSYYMEADLSGVIQASSASYPEGALEAGLAGTFTMKQYWTDIPPGAFMAYTEDNPAVISASDIITLFFHYTDGATQEISTPSSPDAPWVFTLHLR